MLAGSVGFCGCEKWRFPRSQVREQIDAAQMLPGAEQTGSANSVRLLELGQELRHVRAAEVWTEERFVEGWSTSRKRRTK
jgi:hypothetical protein